MKKSGILKLFLFARQFRSPEAGALPALPLRRQLLLLGRPQDRTASTLREANSYRDSATPEFQRVKKLYPRLGTMDLKIASIALVNQAVVLTRNSRDFGQVAGLFIEDWT